jgi:hypothetical protein
MTTQTNSISQAQATQPKAYNLHTVGMGFLNRLRLVESKKGEGKKVKPYWCVSIGALYGVVNEDGRCESSLLDLRVVGKLAIESVKTLQAAFNEEKKVFVEFKAGDIRSDHFQYTRGDRKDQWGSCIKGTLLQLRKAWVNGELVIDNSQQPEQEEAPAESSADAKPAEMAVVAESAVPLATPAPAQKTWQERLQERPKRILVEKSDPEASEKLWQINATGCYMTVKSEREDCVQFQLIDSNLSAA